jgi:hypothetical protein
MSTQTPIPTEAPSAKDTAVPVSTLTAVVRALAAATVTTGVTATREPVQDSAPLTPEVPTVTAVTGTPAETPVDMATATPPPSVTATPSEPSATASTDITVIEPPRPTQIAVAQQLVPEPAVDHSPADEPVKESGQARVMITFLSIGAGVAYIFFALFLALLAGLYIMVRLRQR